jgi:hypothetical protein
MSRGIASVFRKKFGQLQELQKQEPRVGKALKIVDHIGNRSLYYLVTKELSHHKPTYRTLWDALENLKKQALLNHEHKLAIPKLGCGLDGLDWRKVRNMINTIFEGSGIQILVCSFNWKNDATKTVDCYFYNTTGCIKGERCRYRHPVKDNGNPFRDETVLRRGQCNGDPLGTPMTRERVSARSLYRPAGGLCY